MRYKRVVEWKSYDNNYFLFVVGYFVCFLITSSMIAVGKHDYSFIILINFLLLVGISISNKFHGRKVYYIPE
jgi:uncharacterized membrane protein